MDLQLHILDSKRLAVLPLIAVSAQDFYLAGGTALALHLGHRDSIDFDFFRAESFSTEKLWEKLQTIFLSHTLLKTQDEIDTLSCVIDGEVRLSFFGYPYPLLKTALISNDIQLASLLDIGVMKLSAVTGRATWKDYVDVDEIIKSISLKDLLAAATIKLPNLDQTLILKSLTYFDDLLPEPIAYQPGFERTETEIKNNLTCAVKELWGSLSVFPDK